MVERTEIKHVVEAALLGAGRPLSLEQLATLFAPGSDGATHGTLRAVLEELSSDYAGRGIELKQVASGYRIQIRRSMTGQLAPLWEQRAPRYSRAMLETLALIAYRQPVTRGEIEEVRGVAVSTNIVRTLLERGWVRVVGRRDVPGKPALYATTREFLDYFGLKKLDDLPPLSDIQDLDDLNVALALPDPQADLLPGAVPDETGSIPGTDAGGDAASAAERTGEVASLPGRHSTEHGSG